MAFIVSLADFDVMLEEDPTKNSMIEALEVFEEIVRRDVFDGVPLMLFLNKVDLFRDALEQGRTIRECFPQYEGKLDDWQESALYIEDKFKEKLPENRILFAYLTTATDNENCRLVFESVNEHVVGAKMLDAGFL